MRALILVWAAALAAAAFVGAQTGILPRWAAVAIWGCLTLGVWVLWVVLAPHRGSHTDRAGLGLASPAPSPAGSMILEEERAAQDAWAARYEIHEVLVHGMVSGGGAPPWELAEQWPGHDDPWQLPPVPTAGGPAPAVADSAGPGLVSSLPGPAEPTEIRLDLFAAELAARYDDTEFCAGMAADVLAYERRQTADCWAYLATLADNAAAYLRGLTA